MASALRNTSTAGTKKGGPASRAPYTITLLGEEILAATDQAASGFTIFSTAACSCVLIGAKASWAVLAATSLSLVV